MNLFLCDSFLLIVVSIYYQFRYFSPSCVGRPAHIIVTMEQELRSFLTTGWCLDTEVQPTPLLITKWCWWARSSDNDTRQPTLDMLLLHRSANAWHLSLSWFCFRKFKLDFYSIFEFDFVNFFFLVGQTLLKLDATGLINIKCEKFLTAP